MISAAGFSQTSDSNTRENQDIGFAEDALLCSPVSETASYHICHVLLATQPILVHGGRELKAVASSGWRWSLEAGYRRLSSVSPWFMSLPLAKSPLPKPTMASSRGWHRSKSIIPYWHRTWVIKSPWMWSLNYRFWVQCSVSSRAKRARTRPTWDNGLGIPAWKGTGVPRGFKFLFFST